MDVINGIGEEIEFRIESGLADRIVDGFLVPACQYGPAPGQPFDHHEQWRPINRAAGIIAGWALRISWPGEVALAEETAGGAQRLTAACLCLLARRLEVADAAALFGPPPSKKMHAMIAGDKGLARRVAECLVALGVEL